MATASEAFERALRHYQSGQLDSAEKFCRQVLTTEPDFAAAWHLRGVVALQTERYVDAVQYLERYVAMKPLDPEALNNLGIALSKLGRHDDASRCLTKAVELNPAFAEAHANLASSLLESGDAAAASARFRQAVRLRPSDAVVWHGLAKALHAQGNFAEAISAYGRALALQPALADAHYNLGNLFRQLESYDNAIASYLRALELNPSYAEAASNLGTVLKLNDRFDEATACFRRALALQPNNAEMRHNLACGVSAQGNLGEAAALWESVLAIEPNHAEARFNRALLWLLAGDFERGLPELEWRWRTQQQKPRAFTQPQWQGEPLVGRTILLHAEQGFGDTLQFIRYAPLVKALGGTVVVESLRGLGRLLVSCPGIDQLVEQGEQLPPFDVHVPLLSLPGIFHTTLGTIPADMPYLFADPGLIERWRERLSNLKGLRIGINWRGRTGRGTFRQRDLPLDKLVKLSELPGVTLVSLQRAEGRQELLQMAAHSPIIDLGDNVDTASGAFMDTAAIMRNLDLVITSDTAAAHLAGAVGVPVWLALPFVPDWRWFLDRSDSPWYPTMRLFRQKRPGDWEMPFAEMEAALKGKAIESGKASIRANPSGTF